MASPGFVEIDRKYDVDEDTYYGTEDLAFASWLIPLRRRTGRSDAGWHLKHPDDGGRREFHEEQFRRAWRNFPPAKLKK